ncbi:MAG: hypothetical protein GX148_04290 [Clostridiales bacterium]|jgi:hypothetical protein|nr:hypothetical protein [Clostridiales bacterium]
MANEIPTKEIGELLDEVSTKIPKLLTSLMDTLYSAEAGKKMGESVGGFYNELVNAGIPKEEAVKMARDYILSMKDLTQSFNQSK